MAIEGQGLRWSSAEPARQALLVSARVECLNGWIALPARIRSGDEGNGESGSSKGQEIVRFAMASDNSLIVRDDIDEWTTFFPLIAVQHVRGTWWFHFARID